MKGHFISFALSSVLVGGVMWSSDITLDLTPPKEGESAASGYPVEFKYTYDKDGAKDTSITELKSGTDYFWSKDSGSTLSLKEKKQASGGMSHLVATAVFIAPGNNDNLLLENFNYISVGADTITEKGKSDTYFAIQSGPNSYTSFTLNGGNIFSGSNLYIGGIAANSSGSGANNITGGFKNVYLKGTIKVDANAIDQADSAGSGNKNATLNFSSEYNNATYTIDSSATLELTSTGSNTSTVNFNKGIVKYDTDNSKDVFATDQSVLNKGNIKISNAEANTTAGQNSKEKNNINFYIDLKNEGTITLENATLTFKDSGLIISSSGSAGTIDIKANTDTQDKLTSNKQNNKSTLYFDSTDKATAKAFEIASQSINVTGIAPSDASSSATNQELFGSQLTIKVENTGIALDGAKDLNLTGAKDKLTTITIGASADSGTVNDKNTSLIFDSKTVSMDNYVSITVQSGAKLDLTKITGTTRTYTDDSVPSSVNKNTILDFHNQGTMTFKGDGVNTNILDATGKKVILTDYATTKTTCKIGDSNCGEISDAGSIPKNATLTTTEEESAGTMEISGGKTTIQADMAYNFGNLKISNSGTLDLSKIVKAQDGSAEVNGTNEIGFVNAGILTSTGGVIDTRTDQEDTTKTGNEIEYDKMNTNGKSTNSNTKKLIITEAKKEKVNDTRDSGTSKDSSSKLEEGKVWAANKANETRAEFVVDSGATTIRASSLTNKGLTTIQNSGTLNLYCVGTDYCYDGRYWTNFTKDGQGVWYIMNPTSSSDSSEKLKAKQLEFSNDTTGAIILSGGTLNAIDSYKYQEKDDSGNYEDVTKYIYHSLKITGGELGASGGVNSIIRVGYGDSSGSNGNYLTLDNVNLSLRGDSRLFIISQKDEDSTTASNAKADVTWKAGSSGGSNTFTMYLSDDDYTNNTRGIYVLGLADSDGNYKGGTINFTDSGGNGGSGALPTFVIDLSDLSGKNTILLNKQYNFLVAGEIQKGGSQITSANDITMKIYFGKGANTTSGTDQPASDEKEYGTYDETLCKNDSKFCLDAKDTNKSGSVSSGITIGNSGNKEGVVVVDKSDSSKLSDITNGWPSGDSSETYADFVTFNKVYQQGNGTCDINTLEGCAVIGFSAVKSKTLQQDGVSAVFQSIKDRYNQLPNTENTVIKNTLTGINLIENANANASKILQSIVDTDGVASSNILLNLQKFQYTGDLNLANEVAKDLNTLDNSLDAVSNAAQESLELISRVNFTSTLNTSARLAQNSNPYRMNTSFAKAIKSLENKKFADISNSLYSYTDRFDFDHNAWAMAIGGFGGKYSGGYNALGGISAGYDRMLGRVLLGGYATYAYALSSLSSFNGDSRVKTDNSSNNLEIGGYLRAYVDAHEIDVILSETLGFNSLDLNNSITSQNLKFNNFTTNITVRYGYVIPLNVNNGLYIKPLAGLNYMYQYNTQVNGSTDARINANAKHSNIMTLSAFAEIRKYVDDKKYLYIMPGLEQDLFAVSSDSQVYFASSANNMVTYKVDNVVRTYLTVIGGGEIGIRDNMAITFGVGAKVSWDRYFINGNVGFKYKFNSN